MSAVLAVIGDAHAHLGRLARVLARIDQVGVAGVLLVGDLGSGDVGLARLRTPEGDARYVASVIRVLEAVRALGVPVLWVPGNHDLPDLGRGATPGDPLWGNVDGGVAQVGALRVAGLGGAGPARFGFCYEWTEEEVGRRVIPEADVLLCHCPPARTPLDLTRRGEHVGSEALRARALGWDGVLVCGHIHEAGGVARLGDCLCLNAGGLGRPYGADQVGFVYGRDAVVFEQLEQGRSARLERAA